MDLELPFTDHEVTLRQRYESASIANDLLIALWFAIGSVLFFFESTTTTGTWLFLVGSLQLAVRPAIRLSRRIHLNSAGHGQGGRDQAGREQASHESSDDF